MAIGFTGGDNSPKKDTNNKSESNAPQQVNDLRTNESPAQGNKKGVPKNVMIGITIALILAICVVAYLIISTVGKKAGKASDDAKNSTNASITTEAVASNSGGSNKVEDIADDTDGFSIDSNVSKNDAATATTSANPNAVYDDQGNLISENGIYDKDGNVISDDAINPGEKGYTQPADTDNKMSTSATVYSSSDFIKDLNGLDIPAVYNVNSSSWVTDYVNFERKRAIMDDGMELYWVECTYQNKKYRMQIPYFVFASLSDTGIMHVKMEVLSLEGGEKVISFMQPVYDDYKTE